jgi:Mlc titration factor MtfA (ptsG expression regulator)
MPQTAYVLEILRKSMTGDIIGVETLILASWKWPELKHAAEMLKEWNTALSIAVYSEMNNSQREELADEVMTLLVSYAF